MKKQIILALLFVIGVLPLCVLAQINNVKLDFSDVTEAGNSVFIAGFIPKNTNEIYWLDQSGDVSKLNVYDITTKKTRALFSHVKLPISVYGLRIGSNLDRLVYSDDEGLHLVQVATGKTKLLLSSNKPILRFFWLSDSIIGFERADSRSIDTIDLRVGRQCFLVRPKTGLVLFNAYSPMTKKIIYQLTNVQGKPKPPNESMFEATWEDCSLKNPKNIPLPDVYTEGVNSATANGELIAFTGESTDDVVFHERAYIENTGSGKWVALAFNPQWNTYAAILSPDQERILLLNSSTSNTNTTVLKIAKIPGTVLKCLRNDASGEECK
jgi:hypothetical protein